MRIGFREYRARAKARRESLAEEDNAVLDRIMADVSAWPPEMRRRAAVTLHMYLVTMSLIGGSLISLGVLIVISLFEGLRGVERIYPARGLQERVLDVETLTWLGCLIVYAVVSYFAVSKLWRALTVRLGFDNLLDEDEDEDDTAYFDARDVWDSYYPGLKDGDVDPMAVTRPVAQPDAEESER